MTYTMNERRDRAHAYSILLGNRLSVLRGRQRRGCAAHEPDPKAAARAADRIAKLRAAMGRALSAKAFSQARVDWLKAELTCAHALHELAA